MTVVVTVAAAPSMAADIHDWFSWVVIAANAAAGLWALGAHRSSRMRSRWLWALTAAAQTTVFIQAGLGSWLIAKEGREAPDLHALYGFSALVAVGIAYSYRHQLRSHLFLLYGITGLFLMGLGIRAVILDTVA